MQDVDGEEYFSESEDEGEEAEDIWSVEFEVVGFGEHI